MTNTGGGGKGDAAGGSPGGSPTGNGLGGSGVVLIKELNVLQNTSGVWRLGNIYSYIKAGNWSS